MYEPFAFCRIPENPPFIEYNRYKKSSSFKCVVCFVGLRFLVLTESASSNKTVQLQHKDICACWPERMKEERTKANNSAWMRAVCSSYAGPGYFHSDCHFTKIEPILLWPVGLIAPGRRIWLALPFDSSQNSNICGRSRLFKCVNTSGHLDHI